MDETGAESVLERFRPKLIDVFKSDSKALADLMHSEGFLSNDDHETVTEVGCMLNKSERARIMVDSLIRKVRINPENYQNFLQLVQPHKKQFSDVVNLLEKGNANIQKKELDEEIMERKYQNEKTKELDYGPYSVDYVLKDADISVLVEVLARICDKWQLLATALELSPCLIAQCRNDSLILAMSGIIREWIAGNGVTPITLGTLKRKLESVTVGERVTAKDLIANFNKVKNPFPRASFSEAMFPEVSPSEATPRGHVTDSATRSVRITKRKLNSGASGASAAKRSKATKSQASIIDPEVTGYECDLDDEAKDFTIQNLTLLKWKDSDGEEHSLRLRDEMSSKWNEVGDLLGVESSRQEGIDMRHRGKVQLCCRDILLDWLEMEQPLYMANWEGLLTLLKDLRLNRLAKTLKQALDCIREI